MPRKRVLLVAGAAVIATAALWGALRWQRVQASLPPPAGREIAAYLGWEMVPDWEVVRRLSRNPETVFNLLCNDDERVRQIGLQATALLVPFEDVPFWSPEQVDVLRSQLRRAEQAEEKVALARALALAGTPGYLAILALLDSPQHEQDWPAIANDWPPGGFSNEALQRAALAIARNPNVAWANRSMALELVAGGGEHATEIAKELLTLAHEEPTLALPARVARARVLNAPERERLLADLARLAAYPNAEPLQASHLLHFATQHGPAAYDCGPIFMRYLQPLRGELGANAALAIGRCGYSRAVPELIEALENPFDWSLAAGAAEALGRLCIPETRPPLERAERQHPFDEVRRAAHSALAALDGRHHYDDRYWWISWPLPEQREEMLPWSVRLFETVPLLEQGRVLLLRLTSPLVTTVNVTEHGETTSHPWSMLPRQRVNFAGGTLLGYDEGEHGGGLVFVPRESPAERLLAKNVAQLVDLDHEVLVVTTTAMTGGTYLHRISVDPAGIIEVETLARLPNETRGVRPDRDGGVMITDRLRWTRDGVFLAQ